jgi:DHA3 family macrolide efflux protein-like MFS transporter
VAHEVQGRVFSLVGSLAALTAPLGLLLAAPVADLLGVRAWYVAGALACLAMGGGAFFVPSVMRLEQKQEA